MAKTGLRRSAIVAALMLTTLLSWAQTATVWHNPMADGSDFVNGRFWKQELKGTYTRMPERLKDSLPAGVWANSHSSSGLSVMFLTDSPDVTVKYTLAKRAGFANMATADHSGIDLYGRDINGLQHWAGNHMGWKFGDTIVYKFRELDTPSKGHPTEYELFLPPYNLVTSLSIGVDEGSRFRFMNGSQERPLVIYGSSIVQGASPSRPGLSWPVIVKRELDYPVVNMGFSGAAMMEPGVFNALAEIPARAYIIDPMPNSHSLEPSEITRRAFNGVKLLRAKSDAPVLLVEHAGPVDSILRPAPWRQARLADKALRLAYDSLLASGVDNIFYLFNQEIGMDEDCYIEGIHPNDLGNKKQAEAVESKIREMLPEDRVPDGFTPRRQRRDNFYAWLDRHNEIIETSKTENPEIVFVGNSITHLWGGKPHSHNNLDESWQRNWGKWKTVNMGMGWDKIENVLWRINHGELDFCRPEHIVLLIGVNDINTGAAEEDVVRGIIGIVESISARQPQATLHVLKILPWEKHAEKIKRTNGLLEKTLATGDRVKLHDVTAPLYTKDGRQDQSLFRDGLHPNAKGYDRIGKELRRQMNLKK